LLDKEASDARRRLRELRRKEEGRLKEERGSPLKTRKEISGISRTTQRYTTRRDSGDSLKHRAQSPSSERKHHSENHTRYSDNDNGRRATTGRGERAANKRTRDLTEDESYSSRPSKREKRHAKSNDLIQGSLSPKTTHNRHNSHEMPRKFLVDSDSDDNNDKRERSRSPRRQSHRDRHRRHRNKSAERSNIRSSKHDSADRRPRRRRFLSPSPDPNMTRRKFISSSPEDQSRRRHGSSRTKESQELSRKRHRERSRSPIDSSGHYISRESAERSTPNPEMVKKSVVRQRSPSTDPLEEIVGPFRPRPPPPTTTRVRGRGNFTQLDSSVENRFSANYNPSTDVAIPDIADGDDWDLALEAQRDRQRYKAVQRERLISGGFTEQELERWERGEKPEIEANVENVRWKGRGEGRDWDKGKMIDEKGDVKQVGDWTEPTFGRLR
jgi:hypothetical protein